MFPVSDLSLLATEPQAKQRSVLLDGGHGDKPRPCRSARCHHLPFHFSGQPPEAAQRLCSALDVQAQNGAKKGAAIQNRHAAPQNRPAAPPKVGCRTPKPGVPHPWSEGKPHRDEGRPSSGKAVFLLILHGKPSPKELRMGFPDRQDTQLVTQVARRRRSCPREARGGVPPLTAKDYRHEPLHSLSHQRRTR